MTVQDALKLQRGDTIQWTDPEHSEPRTITIENIHIQGQGEFEEFYGDEIISISYFLSEHPALKGELECLASELRRIN